MIIYTAKLPRKRLMAAGAAALCCLFAVLAFSLTLRGRAVTVSAEVKNVKTNDDRLAYLSGLGWKVSPQPIATEELLIPEEFDDSYQGYLQLQADQGFDLTQYKGKRVKRYTYQLTNYPTQAEPVQIALLVYKDKVVGGQIQSSSGSFLHGLTLPGQSGESAPPEASAPPDPSAAPSPSASPNPSAAQSGLALYSG